MIAQLGKDNKNFAADWSKPDPYWHPSLAIGVSQGGASISGLNRDLLLWEERRPAEGASRVLLINDVPGLAGQVVRRTRAGEIVLCADLSSFTLSLTAPIGRRI